MLNQAGLKFQRLSESHFPNLLPYRWSEWNQHCRVFRLYNRNRPFQRTYEHRRNVVAFSNFRSGFDIKFFYFVITPNPVFGSRFWWFNLGSRFSRLNGKLWRYHHFWRGARFDSHWGHIEDRPQVFMSPESFADNPRTQSFGDLY